MQEGCLQFATYLMDLGCRVVEADVLMATDALGPSNAPDDDGLETPDKILSSQLSTGGASDQSPLQLRLARHGNDAHCSNSCKRTPLWVWRCLFHVQIKTQLT